MKGPVGLIVAAALGLLGAALNWLYLEQKGGDFETVSFLGVKQGVAVQTAERLQEGHFAEVRVPAQHAGDLKDFVYLWKDRATVVGIPATRRYQEGDLVFREDYRTPPPELKLEPDERLVWVPVDANLVVPELVNPGDMIDFIVPKYGFRMPTPADASTGPRSATQEVELLGPFRVGSMGNRLGRLDVMQASRVSQTQERQVGVIVKAEGDGLERKAEQLVVRMAQLSYKNVGVVLHPREGKG